MNDNDSLIKKIKLAVENHWGQGYRISLPDAMMEVADDATEFSDDDILTLCVYYAEVAKNFDSPRFATRLADWFPRLRNAILKTLAFENFTDVPAGQFSGDTKNGSISIEGLSTTYEFCCETPDDVESGQPTASNLVLRARSESGLDYAVKIIGLFDGADRSQDFDHEVECLLRLQHKNILRLIDTGVTRFGIGGDDCRRCLMFDWFDGGSLEESMTREWATSEIHLFAMTCAGAMSWAHYYGIVHCDLKPANILLPSQVGDGDAVFGEQLKYLKIADFGLSKFRKRSTSSRTTDEGLYGTMDYIAPECLVSSHQQGQEPVDIYAFGVILFRLLTGLRAEEADPNANRDLFGDHAPYLVRICLRCLQARPSDRYDSFDELIVELELAGEKQASSGENDREEQLSRASSSAGWHHPRVYLAMASAAAVVLMFLTIAWLSQPKAAEVPEEPAAEQPTDPADYEVMQQPSAMTPKRLILPKQPVHAMARFSEAGDELVAATSEDWVVRVWKVDFDAPPAKLTYRAGTETTRRFGVVMNDWHLLPLQCVVGDSQELSDDHLCVVDSGGNIRQKIRTASQLTDVAVSPDRTLIATGDAANNLQLWRVGADQQIARLRFTSPEKDTHGDHPSSKGIDQLVWSTDGRWLYFASQGRLGVVSVEEAAISASVLLPGEVTAWALMPGTDGLTLFIADQGVYSWQRDPDRGFEAEGLRLESQSTFPGVVSAVFANPGQLLVVQSSGVFTELSLGTDSATQWKLCDEGSAITCAVYLEHQDRMVAGCDQGRLWLSPPSNTGDEVTRDRLVKSMPMVLSDDAAARFGSLRKSVAGLVTSPTERILAVVHFDGSVRFLETAEMIEIPFDPANLSRIKTPKLSVSLPTRNLP